MKVKVNKKKVGIIVFLILVLFIGGNVLAAVLGAPNVFFVISNLVNKDVEVEGKDNLLVDRVENEESTKNEVETENEAEDEKIENEDSEVEELTIQAAEELVNDYLKLLFDTSSNSLNLLVNLEFIDDNNKEYETEEIDEESVEYYNTEIKYSEFEDAMLGYMTKECIENDFSEYVKEVDDVLYISATGGSYWYYKVSDLELTKENEEKYNFTGKIIKYTEDHADLTEEEMTPMDIEVTIVKEDDKYIVSNVKFEEIEDYQKEFGAYVPQLREYFYKLEAVSKEQVEVNGLENSFTLNADINKDSKIDEIKFVPLENEFGTKDTFDIFINDEIAYESQESLGQYISDIYVVDLDTTDSYLDIVVYSDMASDDYAFTILSYDGNEIEVKSTKLPGNAMLINKGGEAIILDGPVLNSNPPINKNYYSVSKDKLIDMEIDRIKNILVEFEKVYFTEDLDNIQKVSETPVDDQNGFDKALENNNVRFEENIKAYVIDFEEDKIKVELEDGTEGYLFVGNGNFAG